MGNLKGKGHLLRAKLAAKRMTQAAILAAGVVVLLGVAFDRLSQPALWLFVAGLACLGLAAYCGGTVAERTARALRLNGEWPVEGEVAAAAGAQRFFLCAAWVLILIALIVAAYTRPASPPRPQVQPQPARPYFQGQRPQMRERLEQYRQRRAEQPPAQPPAAPQPPGAGGAADRSARAPQRPGTEPPPTPPEGG